MLHGCLAAAVTPLRDGGDSLDEGAFEPLVDFLVAGGLDGILALGTTGEGILFAPGERKRAVELFARAAAGRIDVAAHCGAQTTADTVELAAHAAEAGATAVAVIGPPYFTYDDEELFRHFAAAASACAPLPFYVYEFAARSGYAIPLVVLARLREVASNFAGLKVSDAPWERFEPYLLEGLDVFVGPESLIHRGLSSGAVGAVSGLASAFPELVSAHVRTPGPEGSERIGALRAILQALPFQGALKTVLGLRGIPVQNCVRAPLRALTEEERAELDRTVRPWLESSSPARAR